MSKVTDTRLKEVTRQIMWAGFENGAVGILRRFVEELGVEVVFELDEEKTPACCEYGAFNPTEPQPSSLEFIHCFFCKQTYQAEVGYGEETGILLPHLESQLECPNEDCPSQCHESENNFKSNSAAQ